MRFGYPRENGDGLREIGHCFFRLILAQIKVSELNERLRVFGRALHVPGNGVFEGLDGLVLLAEGLVR